jgi:hypothetical protein
VDFTSLFEDYIDIPEEFKDSFGEIEMLHIVRGTRALTARVRLGGLSRGRRFDSSSAASKRRSSFPRPS